LKRRFKEVSKPRLFFDRKLVKQGYTRYLSVGKVLPKSWLYVRVKKIDEGEDHVTLIISKLLEEK